MAARGPWQPVAAGVACVALRAPMAPWLMAPWLMAPRMCQLACRLAGMGASADSRWTKVLFWGRRLGERSEMQQRGGTSNNN